MRTKIIYLLFCTFLFSVTINQGEVDRINQFSYYLENTSTTYFIKDIDLFNTQNYNFEYQVFQAPSKLTNTTLNPTLREMSLIESAHLLRRTIVGPTIEEIDSLSTLNINDAVEYLLRDIANPTAPGEWVNYPFPIDYQDYSPEQRDSLLNVWEMQQIQLGEWWLNNIFFNNWYIKHHR